MRYFRIFVKRKIMLSIPGIYDGKGIYPTTEINDHRKYKVIITFVEELDNTEAEELNIRNFGANHSSLAFWDNPKEDIYQDYLIVPESKWLQAL